MDRPVRQLNQRQEYPSSDPRKKNTAVGRCLCPKADNGDDRDPQTQNTPRGFWSATVIRVFNAADSKFVEMIDENREQQDRAAQEVLHPCAQDATPCLLCQRRHRRCLRQPGGQ